MARNENTEALNTAAFKTAISTALEKLHSVPDSDALVLYWENRLFENAEFKKSEANQHTLEEILDDVIFVLER